MDPETLGRQLACPIGDAAQAVGETMAASNRGMIASSIDRLALGRGDHLFEIGFGSGAHVPGLLVDYEDLRYTGIDISAAMVAQARRNCPSKRAAFRQEGHDTTFAWPDASFDAVLIVNTLYFWDALPRRFAEVSRVLTPGGRCAIACIDKTFAEGLAFTRHGFRFETPDTVVAQFMANGFAKTRVWRHEEDTVRKDGVPARRPYWIIVAEKPACRAVSKTTIQDDRRRASI